MYSLQAIASVGAIICSPLALWMSNTWGRKASLVFNSGFYAIGYFIILCTCISTNGVVFKTFLLIGRFITGIGMGWSSVAVDVSSLMLCSTSHATTLSVHWLENTTSPHVLTQGPLPPNQVFEILRMIIH